MSARRSVWIATANLKELMVEDPRMVPGRRRGGHDHYRSVLDVFGELAEAGVELRILHASLPSRPFREAFDAVPALVRGGLELRACPRVHLKAVIVDARLVYLGSANWTGGAWAPRATGGATSSSASSPRTTASSTPCRIASTAFGEAPSAPAVASATSARCPSTRADGAPARPAQGPASVPAS